MIKNNVEALKGRINEACKNLGCLPDDITIVAVSKGRPVEDVSEAFSAGIKDIGENKIQEALLKYKDKNINQSISWHMVGHLQSNKVKDAVKMFSLIHSVDSLRLLEEINKQASKINKLQDVLIQIKTSFEATKFGLGPDKLFSLLEEAVNYKNVSIKGLMTIAPLGSDKEKARPYFRSLRELYRKANDLNIPGIKLSILSMGMTDDFEVAIEEGSNMLRLGRAIFEG